MKQACVSPFLKIYRFALLYEVIAVPPHTRFDAERVINQTL
jgi:hypothetical protein